MQNPIEIFFSYAHEDEDLMNDVRRQLIVYDRQHLIVKWYDRLIPAGGAWAEEIDNRLQQARIILLFVSPHFIESKYCYHVEMAEALRRHKAGQAIVIPIILRPCPWQASPIGHLQALPREGRAVTLWQNRDEACLDVAEGVMNVVRSVSGNVPSAVTNAPEVPKREHAEQGGTAPVLIRDEGRARFSDPRLSRLTVDATQMHKLVERIPSIQIVQTNGDPPELYLLKYNMDGIVGINEDETPRMAKEHLVEVRIHDDYPMSLPFTRFNTPMFHPNVYASGNVCMGWFGIPYNLPDICIHIGKMIDYQIYSTSPLPHPANPNAADWAKNHSSLFPLTNWGGSGLTASANTKKIHIEIAEQKRIRVDLLVLSRAERHSITAPVDIAVRELKSWLVDKLNLSSRFDDGSPTLYSLENRTQQIRLRDELTLQENGVSDDDTLVFVIDMVAG